MQAEGVLTRRPFTLLDVVDVVSRCSRTSEETAAVINHLLRTSRLRFANAAAGQTTGLWADACEGAGAAVASAPRRVAD